MILNEYENLYLNMLPNVFNHNADEGMLYIKGSTNTLDVFIAGIGMNYKSFISSFAMLHKQKCIENWTLSLTLSGFNQLVQNNSSGSTAAVFTEQQQIANAVNSISKFKCENNLTCINLFGFSYGADLLCDIAEGLVEKGIEIKRMVFSDINLNDQTAFLTGTIAHIEKTMSNDEIIDKKLNFIKEVLYFNKDNDEKILDNLEYLRASYKVNWLQMVNSSISAHFKAGRRITDIIKFLNKKKTIEILFFISERTISDIEDGYYNGIVGIINSNTRFYPNPIYLKTKKHFDGISYKTIEKVNKFFKGIIPSN